MSKVYNTDNIIDVFFEHNKPNAAYVSANAKDPRCTYVTSISQSAKEQLCRALSSEHSLSSSICIERFSMQYKERFTLGGGKSHSLTVEPLWSNESDTPLACLKMQSLSQPRMCDCACNLRDGKCRDAFMRKTVGAILFPELYAKQK